MGDRLALVLARHLAADDHHLADVSLQLAFALSLVSLRLDLPLLERKGRYGIVMWSS